MTVYLCFGLDSISVEFWLEAFSFITFSAAGFWGEVTTGTPGLMIPAFSAAISSMVSPSTAM